MPKPPRKPNPSKVPERFIRGPVDRLAVEQGCYYDAKAADRVVQFFHRFLRHSKGQWGGKPFKLLDWQEWELIRPLFGWKRADGTRRFRRAYVEIPKKNGKSTICSGLALYLLLADREQGAEVYSAAADKDQAGIVFNEAKNMVDASPSLVDRLVVVDSRKRINDPASKSWFRALSADAPTKEGLNIHGLIFDELHAQPNRVLWDALKYGGASRRQPLFISITTAGTNRNGICYEQHTYAERVLDGRVLDTEFFPLIYSVPESADWMLPETWRKANPSYGVTISEDSFKADAMEASENVGSQNSFRRYRLNQWVQQEERWLDMAQWRACHSKVPDLKDPTLPFFGGLDLASTQDIAAYVQLFYSADWHFKCHFFIPEERLIKRVKKDKVPYDVWQKQGWLTVTRGNVIDEEHIIKIILESGDANRCREIAYDPWNAPHIVTRLADEGVTMVPVRQGFPSLNYPTKELGKLVSAGKLNHGGNPVLEWMAGNVAVERDAADNIKPSKKKSFEKIDGIVACVMALSRYLVHNAPKKSKYETQGITTIAPKPPQ